MRTERQQRKLPITNPVTPRSNPKRIGRANALPKFALYELAYGQRYPHVLEVLGHELRYRKSRWWRLDEGSKAVMRRHYFAWLWKGKRRIGAFELHLLNPAGCVSNDHFMEVLDINEAHEAEMSVALCRKWRELEERFSVEEPVSAIVHYRSAWVTPGTRPGLFAAASLALLKATGAEDPILVLKAFPLEYEGIVEGRERERAFNRRTLAMMRHYSRIFGVKPLRYRRTQDGWMWRPSSAIMQS